MMRQLGAASAVLTLLVGSLVLPHTHLHASAHVADAHHAQRARLVHSHVTPHHHEPDPAHEATDGEDGAEIRRVDAFVFHSGVAPSAPTPVVIVTERVQFEIPTLAARVIAAHPPAHGPPLVSAAGLRAPPLVPPALF